MLYQLLKSTVYTRCHAFDQKATERCVELSSQKLERGESYQLAETLFLISIFNEQPFILIFFQT